MKVYRILLYCNKKRDDNPYYCSNTRLFQLLAAIESLLQEPGGKVLRIGGGHRTELKHNCEAEVELYTESLQELGEKLNGATGNTEVNYTIFSTGEEVPNDVEQGR